MIIKVGDTVYDGESVPIMVILDEQDKEHIANMDAQATKYCVYPDDKYWLDDDYAKIKEWMRID